MRVLIKSALVAVAVLAVPAIASADTYSTAHFSGGIFGGNANAQAPFTSAGITQGMTFTGTFLIDNSITPPSSGFANTLFSSYADAAVIPGTVDLAFNLGSLAFNSTGDLADGIQTNNGHFNGFTYNDDFTFQNVGYTLSIQGGTFSIFNRTTFQQYVSGYINIGDAAVTGKTPYTPPAVGGGGVPEPATWAMLISGFGGIGAMMRRRRSLVATA